MNASTLSRSTPSTRSKRADAKEKLPAATPEQPRRRDPEIPRSAFNFVADRWDAKRRRQKTLAVFISVVGTAVLLAGGIGFNVRREASSIDARARLLEDRRIEAERELRELFGGSSDIAQRAEAGFAAVRSVFAQDMNPTTEVNQILAVTPEGVRVNNASFSIDTKAAPPTTTVPPVEGQTAPAVVAQPDAPIKLTLSGRGDDYANPAEWKTALSGLPFLRDVAVSYSGSPDNGLLLNVTAYLIAPAAQERLADLEAAVVDVTSTEASDG